MVRHPGDDPYCNGSYIIQTMYPCVALGSIIGLTLKPKLNEAVFILPFFAAVGGLVGILIDPLLNAIATHITQKKEKEEQKLLQILTQNKSSSSTHTNPTSLYVVPQLNLSGDFVNISLTLPYVQQVLHPIINDIQRALNSTTSDQHHCRPIFVGIVGGSGSGKTTLSQLIVRSMNGINRESCVTISMVRETVVCECCYVFS